MMANADPTETSLFLVFYLRRVYAVPFCFLFRDFRKSSGSFPLVFSPLAPRGFTPQYPQSFSFSLSSTAPPFSLAPIGRVVTRFPHFPLLQPGRAGNLRVVDVTRFASKFRVSTYNFAARRVFRRITRTCGLRRGSPTAKATRTFRGSTNGT